MPTISNAALSLQHGGSGSNRVARVSFSVSFTVWEILAGEVFKADVSIRSDDHDRTLVIGTTHVKASSTHADITLSKTFTRQNLDEDADIIINPHTGDISTVNRPDEWVAVIAMAPMVFTPVTATTSLVSGSWGLEGSD